MKKLLILFTLAFAMSCESTDSRIERYFNGENWDKVLENYSKDADSLRIIDICRINVALANKGELADKAFNYFQYHSDGLLPKWNRGIYEGIILANVYYQAGHIALAQRMAFESDVCEVGKHQREMMKLLVKTNLVYGTYDIAEKYICFLEKEGGSAGKWAKAQRRFLYNDSAVESDPEYGSKRACIPKEDFQSSIRGIDEDFKDIIRANPNHHNTVEILGVYYLLDCDFERFRGFLDEFYGTPALENLPISFQEAACFLSHFDTHYWKTVGVTKTVHKRYSDFLDRMSKGLSMEKYRGTYWYYVMRLNLNGNNE